MTRNFHIIPPAQIALEKSLAKSFIGMDRIINAVTAAAASEANTSTFPPYNIIKDADNKYRIELAVAGFERGDIDISVENRTLSVHSVATIDDSSYENGGDNPEIKYLHRGIAKRHFTRTFTLEDYVDVTDATMSNGILTISLTREVPEEKKPKKIDIK